MPHIILTGFMGAGKSTVGSILAEKLQFPLIDLDEIIEAKTGLSPQFYIPRFGEAAFRRLEKICLRQVLQAGPCVLATGGGVVLDAKNRQAMLAHGWVVWLDPPFALIQQRLALTTHHPLLSGDRDQMKLLYQQRIPFYRSCHWRIRDSALPQTIAISILRRYKKEKCIQSS